MGDIENKSDREVLIELYTNHNNHCEAQGIFERKYENDKSKMWEKIDKANDIEKQTIKNTNNIRWHWYVITGVIAVLAWLLKDYFTG